MKMSKGESLVFLRDQGLNTPKFQVFKGPFYSMEEMRQALNDFPLKVSIRTWKRNSVECPFFPNRSHEEVHQILDEHLGNWSASLDEVIFSEGIDPGLSQRCGRMSHFAYPTDFSYGIIEYFEGPGTVRDLDKLPLEERKHVTIVKYQPFPALWVAELFRKTGLFFHKNPGRTLEWSFYPDRIGLKKESYIFWEVL